MSKPAYIFVDVLAVIASLYLQYVESQVIVVASVFFGISIIGKVISNKLLDKKENLIEIIKNEPVIRAFALFLGGTILVFVATWILGSKERKEDKERMHDNHELFVNNEALSAIESICFKAFESEDKLPDKEWFITNGIDSTKYSIDCLLGSFYFDHRDYLKARSYYQKASSECPLAEFYYGRMVYYGLGDIPDKEGLSIIQSAAEKQVADAMYFMFVHSIADNQPRKAMEWYESYLQDFLSADSTCVSISFKNDSLYVLSDERSVKTQRALGVAQEVVSSIGTDVFNMLVIITSFYIENGNPYDAFRVCKRFLSYMEPDGDASEFMDSMEYEIKLRSGNISKREMARYQKKQKRYSQEGMRQALLRRFTKHVLFSFHVDKKDD